MMSMLYIGRGVTQVRKENPGLAVGPMQKILSAMWKGLDEKESARYAKVCILSVAPLQYTPRFLPPLYRLFLQQGDRQ